MLDQSSSFLSDPSLLEGYRPEGHHRDQNGADRGDRDPVPLDELANLIGRAWRTRHDGSVAERGLTPEGLLMDVEVVDGARVAEILESAGKVLPF